MKILERFKSKDISEKDQEKKLENTEEKPNEEKQSSVMDEFKRLKEINSSDSKKEDKNDNPESAEKEGNENLSFFERARKNSKSAGNGGHIKLGNTGLQTPIVNDEPIGMEIEPKKARKKRGSSSRSLKVLLPAKSMINGAHLLMCAMITAVVDIDSEDLELDEYELDAMEPVGELVIKKYLASASPEALLGVIYFTTMVSKIGSAMARKKAESRLKKLKSKKHQDIPT